jgi:hypothetical protein
MLTFAKKIIYTILLNSRLFLRSKALHFRALFLELKYFLASLFYQFEGQAC